MRTWFRGFSLKTPQREALSVWIATKSNTLNKVLSYECENFVQNKMETKHGQNVPKGAILSQKCADHSVFIGLFFLFFFFVSRQRLGAERSLLGLCTVHIW